MRKRYLVVLEAEWVFWVMMPQLVMVVRMMINGFVKLYLKKRTAEGGESDLKSARESLKRLSLLR